ncbi:hypothetical protein Syun_008938 [Stephania yunnanensis]|uniref:Uncharacterized protein n=1 Tax=Stephania yunnanensis TaxID=152371 RepID=A0AAP0KFM7_9MAGN
MKLLEHRLVKIYVCTSFQEKNLDELSIPTYYARFLFIFIKINEFDDTRNVK